MAASLNAIPRSHCKNHDAILYIEEYKWRTTVFKPQQKPATSEGYEAREGLGCRPSRTTPSPATPFRSPSAVDTTRASKDRGEARRWPIVPAPSLYGPWLEGSVSGWLAVRAVLAGGNKPRWDSCIRHRHATYFGDPARCYPNLHRSDSK